MIVGLVPADDGSIDLDGVDLTRLPIHKRASMGLSYLPQEASVFRKLNVEDNIQRRTGASEKKRQAIVKRRNRSKTRQSAC